MFHSEANNQQVQPLTTPGVGACEQKPKLSLWRVVVRALMLAALPLLSFGCATGATTSLNSEAGTGELDGRMTTLVYASTDKNTADIYLSDLPRGALEPDGDLSSVSGQFVHLHVFITPEAGSTPIDVGACSVVFRTIVVARGQLGMYGGGAFLNPKSAPGGDTFAGSISRGTGRLITSTPGFVDKLGASVFGAKFRVPRNEKAAAECAKRLQTMLELMPPPPAPKAKPTGRNAE